jgi:hypothetical protein
MNSFVVSNCSYDGTSGSANPLCTVTGTVNGRNVYAPVCFAFLMAASTAGRMQAALTAVLFNCFCDWYGFQMLPWPNPIPYPNLPASSAVAVQTGGAYPVAPTIVP